MNPRVSIVMPCFNDGEYIQESINSALAQDYDNFELIIVDDGSDDTGTINVLKCQNDPRIKIFWQKHLGPSAARNYAIENADGEYLLPLDADDLIEPSYISKAVKLLQKNMNAGIVYCRADKFGQESGIWDLPPYTLDNMLMDNVIFVTALFRKNDWETVKGFDTQMKSGIEDYDFWLSIIELGREVIQIPEILFHYRIKRLSRNQKFARDISERKKIRKKIYYKHKKMYMEHIDAHIELLYEKILDQEEKIYLLRKTNILWRCGAFLLRHLPPIKI